MIHIFNKLPTSGYIACSGGVDSMAALNFVRRTRNFSVAFFHHNTQTSENAYHFLLKYCKDNDIGFVTKRLDIDKPSGMCYEEFWRNCRYEFFHSLKFPVITAHTLDDCVETFIFTTLRTGVPRVIPYQNGNVIRPFLLTQKADFISWCNRNNVPWIEDETNTDVKYCRNRIRHNIIPQARLINPGLYKVVKKIIQKRNNETSDEKAGSIE